MVGGNGEAGDDAAVVWAVRVARQLAESALSYRTVGGLGNGIPSRSEPNLSVLWKYGVWGNSFG